MKRAINGGSIRRTLWLYLGAFSMMSTVFLFFAARDYGQRAADGSYDHLLVSSALSILGSVSLVDGQWQVDLPYVALDVLAMAPEDRVFYRVYDAHGHMMTGYGDLPSPPRVPLPGEAPLLFDADYSGERVRFVAVARTLASVATLTEVYVQVGQTRQARDALAHEMVVNALLVIAVLTLLSLALVALGVYRALWPLRRIERDLAQRQPWDLKPLTTAPPQEMAQMVGALNHFMERLSNSNETLRAFMGEAAHQMRTPLAALRAQAQLALEEGDAFQLRCSLTAIERNASHMSRLLNQLLSDASAIHRTQIQHFEVVNLLELIHQAVSEVVPYREEMLCVQWTNDPQSAWIRGDALLLREALKNLVDNACKYGGGSLQLTLTSDAHECVLTLADQGPGIAPSEAERVFERFVRGVHASPGGAGLGLAIVKRIIDNHRGRIDLSNRIGGGLMITLGFPR
ncbi:sensor histidine kinase [Xylella fastidiosa subsp. multiplex]|uniref:histidine kinase n=1 Tax=Xylella fastidiosa subsp. multiplex TaxID=644357 RepID=A0A9Q4MKC2_XYLFS|nr:sensor histidine kinase [Xylella fastidiosa]ACA11310.1 two-component system, sensor protein [Xylella fastidiosa M12]KAJ4852515.1 sensor histidine kinase [Xylella fastidiosa subsp. multiplex]MBE0268727.1 sensor histidine kinase [Xylella fastidiosa subsp. multiplex]MBE0275441.1 sensor histidine kinase [Xylella fastidiosa subsp. multiplex]MBE0277632.1 sensor histidine kinase [Xylella fastidiosa subsp. multiplex]